MLRWVDDSSLVHGPYREIEQGGEGDPGEVGTQQERADAVGRSSPGFDPTGSGPSTAEPSASAANGSTPSEPASAALTMGRASKVRRPMPDLPQPTSHRPMTLRKGDLRCAFVAAASAVAASVGGQLLTGSAINGWYRAIRKAGFTPPDVDHGPGAPTRGPVSSTSCHPARQRRTLYT
jgi:hypothetical protein